MKTYHKNPRQITKKQFSDLETWLAELGDLSGIVHDLNSDEIVSGNMRSRVFDPDKCEIVITEQLDEPDEQGTVAHGYIIWQGKKYAYRQVRWTAEQCEKANIVSNKAGGDFDFDIMGNEFEIDNLLEWGFQKYELGIVADDMDIEEAWEGMPEFDNKDLRSFKQLIVHFANQSDFDDFLELVDQKISDKVRYMWYPKAEIMRQGTVIEDES